MHPTLDAPPPRMSSNRRNSNTAPRPIIARFLRYKDVEEIFSLGRRLEGTDFQMFRDLPLEIIKRRKDQMAVFKQARRQGMSRDRAEGGAGGL